VAERRLQLLEEQVQQLQQQVDFLEDLLRQRHDSPAAERLP
jgi:conjugal transfer/entry exclusion protein